MSDQLLPYSYLVIEGNIGAGKTSLAEIISNKFNTNLVLESFAENTFLPQFYEQPERFAFPLEMSFLAERFQQIKQEQEKALANERKLVGDYIFEKSLLFASVTLKGAEFELFERFYNLITSGLKKPELILYLHKSTERLRENITKRGRDYEQNIRNEYLDNLSTTYINHLQGINNQRIVILDSDNIDFVNDAGDLKKIIDLICSPLENRLYRLAL
ncbi:MAG: deoxynucleoside kinase [Bacteroidia bacterium]